ncbi:4-amino-4-deoxychorismate lyase [Amphritea atlantica]|jgi:4-amino-4-deoxychorismate lyase|uniref:Aminodeoxychorismate lyase n=1 Tax=Amphritea atlantica TaxID=355243 RepID=A0A1H9IJ49_9GAMM|nr:aminodeoxychorismate lyase [Amphritea atlantica]SEQ74630.1 4-amino-4-deoxychorismate lyase [Amphritea atlantica]
MRSYILINGQSEQSIPVTDRGLAYGHGLFETITLNGSQPVVWQAHLDRLRKGAGRLGIPLPVNIQALLEADLAKLLQLQPTSDTRQVLKITITRGCGGRGYAVDDKVSVNRIVQLTPFPDYPDQPAIKGVSVRLCQTRLALSPLLAGIKHLNRLEQVLARAEWDDSRIREGLVLDSEGFLVEGTMSNLFWVQDGELYTPQLDRCGVAGIIRQTILTLAEQTGVTVCEGLYAADTLAAADEVFVCNSVIAIWPVTRLIADQGCYPEWPVGPLTRLLQSRLAAEGIY